MYLNPASYPIIFNPSLSIKMESKLLVLSITLLEMEYYPTIMDLSIILVTQYQSLPTKVNTKVLCNLYPNQLYIQRT